jgi:hypothetical protein
MSARIKKNSAQVSMWGVAAGVAAYLAPEFGVADAQQAVQLGGGVGGGALGGEENFVQVAFA